MSRSKFAAWFAEQFPHHAKALKSDLHEARREAGALEKSAAKARQKVQEIEDAMEAHDTALKAWVANGARIDSDGRF